MKAMKTRERIVAALAALGVGAVTAALLARRGRYTFRGKTVLITGGSRGLGLVMAREFAREGARLVLCGRDGATLDRARSELEARGTDVLAVTADVTRRDDIDTLVAAARERFGHIDVLVNNAGVIEVGPLDTMTDADYAHAMSTHFWGPLHLMQAVLPAMRARREGRVVNVSSIGGVVAVPHMVPYSASKFALAGLSEGMYAELAGEGVRITTVYPGLMRTGSPRNADFKGRHREEYAWFTLSDSLPFTSVSAVRAARRIVAACRRGDPRLTLSLTAKLATLAHGVFPGLVVRAMALAGRLLPAPGGVGTASRKGHESESPVTRSVLTALDEKAAAENNQNPPPEPQPA
jgi:NAD(P)-dependent dehydrogenase (short-subunit alcohol dehydrogenase family)